MHSKEYSIPKLKSQLPVFDKCSHGEMPKKGCCHVRTFSLLSSGSEAKWHISGMCSLHDTLPHYRTKVTWPSRNRKTMSQQKPSCSEFTQVSCQSEAKMTNTFSQLIFNKGFKTFQPVRNLSSVNLADKHGLFRLMKVNRPPLSRLYRHQLKQIKFCVCQHTPKIPALRRQSQKNQKVKIKGRSKPA